MTEPVQSPPSVTNTNEANAIILQRVKEERMPKVDMKMAALVIALKTYKQTLGTYPTGTWREISGALMGKNDKNFVFIEGNGWTNRQGELVDPWGGTYFFSFEANTLTVKSSGPNGIFGDADDIVRVKQY
jgi:hypothetical protein